MRHIAASNYPGGAQSGPFTAALYQGQWHNNAGRHVYIPCEGEPIVYFPQGHIQQIEPLRGHEVDYQLPFSVPDKIVCKVVNVQLLVGLEIEEVYAEVTLLPYEDQSEMMFQNPPLPEPLDCTVSSFCKTITESDTIMSSSMMSRHNHFSVLAIASHAVATRTRFSVVYKPRATRSAFIISVNKYLKAQNPKPCVGMKFMMELEGERVPEERFSGTILAVGYDASPKWPESEWESLKVQWDEASPILPDRVSSWDIRVESSDKIKWSCCCLKVLKRLCCLGRNAAP